MGNRLVSNAPSNIRSTESYFPLIVSAQFRFLRSLRISRCVKVALARHKGQSLCVVKIFPINDSTIPYNDFVEELKALQNETDNHHCFVPYKVLQISPVAVFLIRSYIRNNLYERMTMRPPLSNFEKLWITFQLLIAIEICHSHEVYHGDIKPENILITSWNHVAISDFASFKPTWLPSEDPSAYHFFFVSTQRDACYLAPERFKSNEHTFQDDGIVDDFACSGTVKMDVFSVGCVIAEIFTSKPLFTLGDLLKYKQALTSAKRDAILSSIDDVNLRNIIAKMTDCNPENRPSVSQCLSICNDGVFPSSFYRLLLPITTEFGSPSFHCELIIKRMHETWKAQVVSTDDKASAEIACSIILSCLRSVQYLESLLHGFDLIHELLHKLDNTYVEERLLAYCVHFLCKKQSVQIRCVSLNLMVACLTKLVQSTDYKCSPGLFTDYIFKSVSELCTHDSEKQFTLRLFFEKIPKLVVLALEETEKQEENSEQSQVMVGEIEDWFENQIVRYLHAVSDGYTVLCWLTEALLQYKDIFKTRKMFLFLLSHLATLPNKFTEDWRTRQAFFECIFVVSSIADRKVIRDFLRTFLYHGIADDDVFVVSTSITLLEKCIVQAIFRKRETVQYVKVTALLVSHPCALVRQGVSSLLETCMNEFHLADYLVYVEPLIRPVVELVDYGKWWYIYAHQWRQMDDTLMNDTLDLIEKRKLKKHELRHVEQSRQDFDDAVIINPQSWRSQHIESLAGTIGPYSSIVLSSSAMNLSRQQHSAPTIRQNRKEAEQRVALEPRPDSVSSNPADNNLVVPFHHVQWKTLTQHLNVSIPKCYRHRRDKWDKRSQRQLYFGKSLTLVTNIAEHDHPIKRLAINGPSSIDPTTKGSLILSLNEASEMKIWDMSEFNSAILFKSKWTIKDVENAETSTIQDAVFVSSSCFCTGSRDSRYLDNHKIDLYSVHKKMPIGSRKLNETLGYPLHVRSTANPAHVVAITSKGYLLSLDLRAKSSSSQCMSVKLPIQKGFPRTVEIANNNLVALVGTDEGYIDRCDLRYCVCYDQTKLFSSKKCSIRDLLILNDESVSVILNDNDNDVCLWNQSLDMTTMTFASSKHDKELSIMTSQFYLSNTDMPQLVLSDSNGCVRAFNVSQPELSTCLIAPGGSLFRYKITKENRVVEELQLQSLVGSTDNVTKSRGSSFQSASSLKQQQSLQSQQSHQPQQCFAAGRAVSDMCVVQDSNGYALLLAAGSDGVVSIWK